MKSSDYQVVRNMQPTTHILANIVSKFQVPSSTVCYSRYFEDLKEKAQQIDQSVYDKHVCRRAPATSSLFNIVQMLLQGSVIRTCV